MTATDLGPIRLAILDSDSGFVRVLVKRADDMGWQYRRLEAPPRMEEFVAMRVNALVVDLALLGEGAWDFLDRLERGAAGSGVVVATGRSSVAQRVRGLRAGADDWVTKPAHPEEVLARVEAVVRRRKQASARVETGPLVAGELEIRADQFQAFARRHQRRPDAPRVRGASAAGADRGQGASARGDLPVGVGLRDGPRRPLCGRVRPQGPAEAREGFAGLELHPHPLRRRLPLPAGARRGRRRGPRAGSAGERARTASQPDGRGSISGCSTDGMDAEPAGPRDDAAFV